MFKDLRLKFKGLVTTLTARFKLVTFLKLHSLLLTYEFLHIDDFSMLSIGSMPVDDMTTPYTSIVRQSTYVDRGNNFNLSSLSGRNGLFNKEAW
jgi:hypothetical protein